MQSLQHHTNDFMVRPWIVVFRQDMQAPCVLQPQGSANMSRLPKGMLPRILACFICITPIDASTRPYGLSLDSERFAEICGPVCARVVRTMHRSRWLRSCHVGVERAKPASRGARKEGQNLDKLWVRDASSRCALRFSALV